MTKDLIIPTDDPSVMKAFDPYSVQGMINALTFFARERGKDVVRDHNTYAADMKNCRIVLVPTESGLATKHIMVNSIQKATSPWTVTEMWIFNPDKVEYDEGEAIKFYARDPSAVLIIEPAILDTVETTLKAIDVRHPDRVHGANIRYVS